jgi:hypothetical protein
MTHRPVYSGLAALLLLLLAGCGGARPEPVAPAEAALPFLPNIRYGEPLPPVATYPVEVATLRLEPVGGASGAALIERRAVYDPRWISPGTVAMSRAFLHRWLTEGTPPRDAAFAGLTPATFAEQARGEVLLLRLEPTTDEPWPDGVPRLWDYRLYARAVGPDGVAAESQLVARAVVRQTGETVYRHDAGPGAWEIGAVNPERLAVYLSIVSDFDPPDLSAAGVRGTVRTWAHPVKGRGLFRIAGERRVDVRAYLEGLEAGE